VPSRAHLPRIAAAACIVALAAGLAACGSSTTTAASKSHPAGTAGAPAHGSSTTKTTAPASSPNGTAGAIASIPAAETSPAGVFGTEPTVTVPSGPPPTRLESANLIVGTGATAEVGDTLTVQYVGVDYATGKPFGASWGSGGGPFSFTLSTNSVIPGWVEGVAGMKVGGRRELVIPPSLGYGTTPPAGSPITPNETLVFVIDLLKVGS
jgi:peptidylprolyl isomerase